MTLEEALDALEAYVCEFRIELKHGKERAERIQSLMQRARKTMTLGNEPWNAIQDVVDILLKLKMANIIANNRYNKETMDPLWSAWKELQQDMSQHLDRWQEVFQTNNEDVIPNVWGEVVRCVRDFVNKKTKGVQTSTTSIQTLPPSQEVSSANVVGHSAGTGASSSSGLRGAFAGASAGISLPSMVPPASNLTSAFGSALEPPNPTTQDDDNKGMSQIRNFLEKMKSGQVTSMNGAEWEAVQAILKRLHNFASDEKNWKEFAEDVKRTITQLYMWEIDGVRKEDFDHWSEETKNLRRQMLINEWLKDGTNRKNKIIDDLLRELDTFVFTSPLKRQRTEVLNQDSNMGVQKREPIDLDASDLE
jgi:hypothetical protein